MRGKLFVGYKPLFLSSNQYLAKIKRKMGAKSAGYSGTLDPFAAGCLIIGTDGASKLFNYIKLEPKVYRAVLWLGAKSETLDIEGVTEITDLDKFDIKDVEMAVSSLVSVKKIIPPKYSAKKVGGIRAYELARKNIDVELKECNIEVFSSKLLHYSHPFVSFEVSVSKGTYVRTLGEIVAKTLGVDGSLSYLERVSEGDFCFNGYKPIDIKKAIDLPKNRYKKDKTDIMSGKKVNVEDFEIPKDGLYLLELDRQLSIIEIKEQKVIYKLNNIEF